MLQHWLTPISISGTTHFIEHHFRDHITSQIQNKIPPTLQNTPRILIDISLTPVIERVVHIVPTPPPTTTAKRMSGCRHLGSDQFINSIIWLYSGQGSWFFFWSAPATVQNLHNHHCGAKDRYSYAFGSAEGLESSMSRARTCTWSAQGGDIVTTYMYVVRSQVVKPVPDRSVYV